MLLKDSCLAEVHLWNADCHHPLVPRKWRLCCFCTDEVEDLPHAMFGAVGHQSLLTSGLLFLNPYSFSLHLYILLLSQLHQSLSSSLHCPTGIYVMFLLNWPMILCRLLNRMKCLQLTVLYTWMLWHYPQWPLPSPVTQCCEMVSSFYFFGNFWTWVRPRLVFSST